MSGILILRTVEELRRWRSALAASKRVAFVPTMGFLHEGHQSLLHEARRRVPEREGAVVLSIFVNPTQFGPREDLATYPRDEAGDLKKAQDAGVDVAFCPLDPQEMYPPGDSTWVSVAGLDATLCGATRPGHFRGVCTVVTKLWCLVRPDIAIFGEKDYQQLAIIRRMHTDLFLGGEVVGMPIVREADGLALSSRNVRLDADARRHALAIPRLLERIRMRFAGGERDVSRLLADALTELAPGQADYVEIVDAANLQPVTRVEAPVLVAIAARYAGVRLIDNIVLTP